MGTARLVWDNSYSWMSTKTLSYVVQLENIGDDKDYIVDRPSSLAKLGGNIDNSDDNSAPSLSEWVVYFSEVFIHALGC